MGMVGELLVLALIIYIIMNSSSGISKKKFKKILMLTLEKGYFEGQKDALENKFNIEKTTEDDYIWVGLPMDYKECGDIVTFNPNRDFEKQVKNI